MSRGQPPAEDDSAAAQHELPNATLAPSRPASDHSTPVSTDTVATTSPPDDIIVPAARRDMLSELPDDVLRKVALFVDVDCAVHMSMLSRRWCHYLNDTVSNLKKVIVSHGDEGWQDKSGRVGYRMMIRVLQQGVM